MEIYPYQEECLDAIESARRAGHNKALVVMATGLGKTVVSAFQLKRMLAEAPGRVLYVGHQEEILHQARRTYERFLAPGTTYGYFYGREKHLHKVDVLFALFQTMANKRELFARDEFAYVVIDEAHHVHASTYRPTVEYFQPDFMIGLTATPDRADQKDITELMGEPVFHLDLFEALAEQHLTPINYRLMTDELQNLEVLETPAGKLSIAELNRTVFVPKRDEEIVRIIEEKASGVSDPRTIIFCSSVEHAEQLAELMPYAQVIHSKIDKRQIPRRIAAFRNGHSHVAITVDMFNEGIDIPEANVIVFLRSTASRTIYLQQLGRGLRRAEGKEEVLVLDFVANCERIEMINSVKSGIESAATGTDDPDCIVNADDIESKTRGVFTLMIDGAEFDERLVDLVKIVQRAGRDFTKEELTEQLLSFAGELGRTPTRRDMDAHPMYVSSIVYVRVFGKNWNSILKEVGLTITKVADTGYTEEDLVDLLLDFARKLGRTPTKRDVDNEKDLPSSRTFVNRLGMSWNDILTSNGMPPVIYRDSNEERRRAHLVSLLQEKYSSLGRVPTRRDVDGDESMPSSSSFAKSFGSWNGALTAAGFIPGRQGARAAVSK